MSAMTTPDNPSDDPTDDQNDNPSARSLTFSVTEIAELLGISRSTAYESVRDGTIPSLRFRRRIVIPKSALERLLGPGDQYGRAA